MKYRYSYKIFVESEDKEFMEERKVKRADSGLCSLPEIRSILEGAIWKITKDAKEDEQSRGGVSK